MRELIIFQVGSTKATKPITRVDKHIDTYSSIRLDDGRARVIFTKTAEFDAKWCNKVFVTPELDSVAKLFIAQVHHLHLALAIEWLKRRIAFSLLRVAI
jgi:hypothetical protein